MQTLPNAPIPTENYDTYALRLFKRSYKANKATAKHQITRLEVEAEKWFFAFLLTLLNVAIWLTM